MYKLTEIFMTFSSVLGQQPLSRMIRPRRWLPLACAFVTMTSYCSFLMINDLLVARKPIKSVQGEKKEEMLIPGWNSYDIIFVVTLTEPSK